MDNSKNNKRIVIFLASVFFAFCQCAIAAVGDHEITGDLTVSGGDIFTPAAMNLKPSGDTDDYLSVSTVSGVPRVTIEGGVLADIISSSPGIGFLFQFLGDDFLSAFAVGWNEVANVATIDALRGTLKLEASAGDVDINATGEINLSADADMLDNAIKAIAYLDFDLDAAPATEPEGRVWWNDTDMTANIASGIGPVNQVGQEVWLLVHNNTGSQINDGQVVFISGVSGGRPSIVLAKADVPTTADRTIGFATMDIPNATEGIVTTFGLVRDIDTSSCSAGDQLYLSAATAGAFTNVKPTYPNYIIKVGNCCVSSATVGTINVNIIGRIEDILENFFNASIIEPFTFTVSSDGATITGSLTDAAATGQLTYRFSTGFFRVPSTPITVTIDSGVTEEGAVRLIYVDQTDNTLKSRNASYLDDWPTGEIIKVARVKVGDPATVVTNGAWVNQNLNDHLADTDLIGHDVHLSMHARRDDAKWRQGVDPSVTINTNIGTPDDVFYSSVAGIVSQLHLQTFDAHDMAAGDDAHITNDNAVGFKTITNLNTELTDSAGVSMATRYFWLVRWGIANKSGEEDHIYVNLPSGSYTTLAKAQSDSSNTINATIGDDFTNTGFLISADLFLHSNASGGTWTLIQSINLRGNTPNTAPGGGSGSIGVTTFDALTDVPGSKVGEALKILQVNAGETALEYTSVPTITADNISDGGSNAIITTTQETNFETAFTHSSSDGKDHSDVVNNNAHTADNTQAHSDYLLNSGSDTMAGTLTADGLTLGANENITLGAETLDHDGTDFVLSDSLNAGAGTFPDLTLTNNQDYTLNAPGNFLEIQGQTANTVGGVTIRAADDDGDQIHLRVSHNKLRVSDSAAGGYQMLYGWNGTTYQCGIFYTGSDAANALPMRFGIKNLDLDILRFNIDGSIVINDNGVATSDFRVESDNVTDVIFVDAGAETLEFGIEPLMADGFWIGSRTDPTKFDDAAVGATGSTTMYIGDETIDTSVVSDRRAKTNIQPMGDAISTVMQLAPKIFDYKPEYRIELNREGFIAQDVEAVYPQAVGQFKRQVSPADATDPNNIVPEVIEDLKYVKHKELVPLLIKATQQQQTTIENLNQRILTLETKTAGVMPTAPVFFAGMAVAALMLRKKRDVA